MDGDGRSVTLTARKPSKAAKRRIATNRSKFARTQPDSGSKIVLPLARAAEGRTTVATPADLRVGTLPTGSVSRRPPAGRSRWRASGHHFGEHLQQAIGAVVDGESLRVVARCRGSAQCRGAWVGQLVKRGGEPGDVVDTDRRAARRLEFGQPTGRGNNRRDAQLHRQHLHAALGGTPVVGDRTLRGGQCRDDVAIAVTAAPPTGVLR